MLAPVNPGGADHDPGTDPDHDPGTDPDAAPFRYDAALADRIETGWQSRWDACGTYETANLSGNLTEGSTGAGADAPKLFVMDMFPYPSGSGLHVGHPLGFIGTDVFARFKRMNGHHVLHTMGYDAFGLPAEEHARQTGEHPRTNTERNIANMSRQLARMGLGHDRRRAIATADADYYRWTQWIFLQIFDSWYDHDADRARPIAELEAEFAAGTRATADGRAWAGMDDVARRTELSRHRLAYLDEAPVNWCPRLGTVLSNEEVTADGLSERGDHPVFKRPLKQWMMRLTHYADRLLADLDDLDWPESVKTMQRNWIGRSEGARIRFPVADGAGPAADAPAVEIEVFTTRPDTVFGTTAMVLAPEHPLVETLTAAEWPDATPSSWTGGAPTPAAAVEQYLRAAAALTDIERHRRRAKTGVYLGSDCVVPVNGLRIPVFVADYAVMGYGTGAVMSVPGEDQRDWDFAAQFGLDVVRTVAPPPDFDGEAWTGEGTCINSDFLDGLAMDEAKAAVGAWLVDHGHGEPAVEYKLRDWLFSRQRYWGEPFPIVFDETGLPLAVPVDELPVRLPELIDWAPRALDEHADPEPPLGRAADWAEVSYDLGDGERTYRRELNTMPQWAGSCWYYLRYLDPTNDERMVDPDVERYWMGAGGVDLYVGGVEHAVLHLLYSRFWHKVLYDLGHVSGVEPFGRLYNQGYILAAAYQDARGVYVDAESVVERDGSFVLADGGGDGAGGDGGDGGEGADGTAGAGADGAASGPLTRTFGKMGKSLRNAVAPDDIYAAYGADTLRLYEMFMGPLDQDRPWETRSVVGSHRLLQRVWRNLVDEQTGALRVLEEPAPPELTRLTHRTVAAVAEAMEGLRFNSAIARISELNNELTRRGEPTPRAVADVLVRLLAPLVPHIAEELWALLHGRPGTAAGAAAGTSDGAAGVSASGVSASGSVVFAPFPEADPAMLTADTVEVPVQVDGKVRSRVTVPADVADDDLEAAALADDRIRELVGAGSVRRVVVVSAKLVNIVTD